MGFKLPYGPNNYMGEWASDAEVLVYIRSKKYDTNKNGTGNPENGMWYYNTNDHKPCYYVNNVWCLGSSSFISLTKSANQVIPDLVWTNITWDQEEWDTANWHDNVTNNERITVNVTCFFLATFCIEWMVKKDKDYSVRIQKNGVTTLREICNNFHRDDVCETQRGAFVVSLASGDYITLQAYHNNGATRDILATKSVFQLSIIC